MAGFKKILYFIDREDSTTDLMRLAVTRALSLGAEVTFASVIAPGGSSLLGGSIAPERLEQLYMESEVERLEQLVDPLRDSSVRILTRVLTGNPAATIVRAVVNDGYQMVLKAPTDEPRGLRERFLGSIDMRLIRACPCPIAIMGAHRPETGRSVTVAAVDVIPGTGRDEVNEDLNHRVLDLSRIGLDEQGTRLHVIHAWTLYGESIMRTPRAQVTLEELEDFLEKERTGRQQKLEELVDRYLETLSGNERNLFAPELHLVKGEPSSVIPSELERLGADLLVMGTIARTGVSGFLLGNTAEKILGQLECSVVVTKPEGFVTPVPIS